MFGNKVEEDIRELVKRISGITREKGTGVYLGLPEAFVECKIRSLKYLEERGRRKIQS